MQVEVRGDSVIIDGYVNAVGRDSRPIRCQTGDFVEQVEPGVFGKALKRAKNIKLLLNHRTDRELGSTAQGNLTLTEDNIGLRAHAEVGDPEIIRKARNNQLSGWSFGMYVNESEMEQRSNTIPRRRLKDIDMFEVSIIDTSMMPCYAGTSVECRAEGENALLETRAFEDTVEMNETLPENYFEELEERAAQLRAESELVDMEKRIEELRYNPYHDPTNGRFTTSSGSGGGYLFVGKGQKGKGAYVFDSKNFKSAEVDIDCSKDKNFVTSSKELLWESIHFPKNYKENLDHGDLEKDEYDELMSRVLKDVKENQVLNFQDSDGKSYTAKGTSFLYNGSKYGMIGRKKNNFVVDHNSKKIFPIRQGYNSDFTKKSLSNNIISAIETQNFLNSLDKKSERAFNEVENKLAQLRAECELVDTEKRIEELRYNPYHDPTNGRFTTASGSGGGYLFVGKGEKGKGQYVFDRDIDSEYDEWKKLKKASKRELDSKQIDRANAQGSIFFESGTAIKNTYDREYEEIENLNISEEEKIEARNKIYDYSAAELQARQKYFDVYKAGPARKVANSDKAFDKSQKIKGEHEAYISSLRDKSSRNTYKAQEEKEAEAFRKAGAEAEKTGAREITVNGETWFRTTKTSHTWSKGTLKDYKAKQAYDKTQKNLWMGDPKRKPWSSLTEEEKMPFYKAARAVTLDEWERRAAELRYNPYHDPTNGRFTTASGGGGGYLFVGKGEKGKGQYVFDRDIDSEYDEWKKSKGNGVSAEDKAVREATGGVVQNAAKTTVEATVRKRNKSARPEFDKTVLEAKVDSDGNIILDYAKGNYSGNYGDEYQTVTYNIQSGFVNGEPVNLDLSKAKTISGKTYDARQAAKAAGMAWDSTYDMYISKDHLYNVDTTFSREKFEKMSDAEVDRVYHATAFKSYLDSMNYTFAQASAKAQKLKPRSKVEQIDRMEKVDKNNKLLEQQREKWAKTPWAGN